MKTSLAVGEWLCLEKKYQFSLEITITPFQHEEKNCPYVRILAPDIFGGVTNYQKFRGNWSVGKLPARTGMFF